MLELRQFDLQLALEAACALREDIEDQAAAIEHAHAGQLLEIALLAGRERMIDQDDLGLGLARGAGDLLRPCRCRRSSAARAARAVRLRSPPAAAPAERASCWNSSRSSRLTGGAEPKAHEHRALTGARSLKHAWRCR